MAQILYFIREAFRALVEAKVMTFVSIATVAVTLFFLTIVTLSIENVDRWIARYKSEASVIAYFELDSPREQHDTLLIALKSDSRIDSVHYVSRSDAYHLFSSMYGKELLSGVDENPFPASLEIVPAPNSDISALESDIVGSNGVESVSVSREWIEQFGAIRHYITVGAIVFIVIILAALYFTITNTIKLTVYARQELLRNMEYVGASYWYIRVPFLLEGIIQGVAGAGIAWGGVVLLSLVLKNLSLYWGDPYLFPVMISIGMVLGFIGSLDAVRNVRTVVSQS